MVREPSESYFSDLFFVPATWLDQLFAVRLDLGALASLRGPLPVSQGGGKSWIKPPRAGSNTAEGDTAAARGTTMLSNAIPRFLDRLRRSELLREGAEQTDSQLLEAFVGRRDTRALEALVRRHAPMVWSVCRRTLANHHEAEDAFQATFLVLFRRAASLRSPELLANWLYGVAL